MAEKSIVNVAFSRYNTRISEKLECFISNFFQDSEYKYATFSFPINKIDPLGYLQQSWGEKQFHYYWENPNQQFAIAAGGKVCVLSAEGEDRFTKINARTASLKQQTFTFTTEPLPHSGLLFLGGFSFNDQISSSIWKNFSSASLTVPEWAIISEKDTTIVTLTLSFEQYDSPESLRNYILNVIRRAESFSASTSERDQLFSPLPSRPAIRKEGYTEWIQSVNDAKSLIKAENFEKIVVARKLSLPYQPTSEPYLLHKLRQQYPSCYNFLIHQSSGDTFIGSTPERLGSIRKHTLLTEALAGSSPRGNTLPEDTRLARQLAQSPKNLSEHEFVVRDIENQLKSITPNVWRESEPQIKKLSTVQHLHTSIRAKLKKQSTILEVIEQLHPTPAVGGYPWKDAKPYIKELEHFDRGWYAGPFGWMNAKGDGDFAVAIRSSLIGQEHAHFFAGCGIVSDSDPDKEWEETNLKLKPMLSAFYED